MNATNYGDKFISKVAARAVKNKLQQLASHVKDENFSYRKLSDNGEIIYWQITYKESGLIIHKQPNNYVVDLDPRNLESGLVRIRPEDIKDFWDELMEVEKAYDKPVEVLEYSKYINVMPSDEEDTLLNICGHILDTLDGKDNYYPDLRRATYKDVTIINNGSNFLIAAKHLNNVWQCSLVSGGKLKFVSRPVHDFLCEVMKVIEEKLPNHLPTVLQAMLDVADSVIDQLSDEEKEALYKRLRDS